MEFNPNFGYLFSLQLAEAQKSTFMCFKKGEVFFTPQSGRMKGSRDV